MDADWVQPLLKVRGVKHVELKMQLLLGPSNMERLFEMEREIEKHWTTS